MSKNVYLGVAFALIWTLSFICTQIALNDFSPIWLAGVRLSIAGLILFLIIKLYNKTRIKFNLKIILAGIFTQAIYLGASYWALVNVTTSIVNIVVSTVPMFSIPMAYLYFREKVELYETVSFLVTILGVGVSLSDKIIEIDLVKNEYILSILLLLLSVLSLSFGNALSKTEITRENMIEFCFMQFSTSGFLLVIIAIFIEPFPTIYVDMKTIISIIFLILFGSIIGTLIWFNLLFNMTMIGSSSFFILTPMLGIIFGLLFFGEELTLAKVLGAMIISGAIFLRFYLGWYKK